MSVVLRLSNADLSHDRFLLGWFQIPASWLGPCLPPLRPSLFSQSHPHKTLTGSEHTALYSPKLVIAFRIIFKILALPPRPTQVGRSPLLWGSFPPLFPYSLVHCAQPHWLFCHSSKHWFFLAPDSKSPSKFSPASSLASFSSIFKQPLIREAFDDHPLLKFRPSPHHSLFSSCCISLRSKYHYLTDYKSVLYLFTIYLPH